MRSLLIAPADENRLAEALKSGADAIVVDLARAAPRKGGGARRGGAVSERDARPGRRAGACRQDHTLDSGETDADLDAVMAGRPTPSCYRGALGLRASNSFPPNSRCARRVSGLPTARPGSSPSPIGRNPVQHGKLSRLERSSAGDRMERGTLARRDRRRDGPRPPRRLSRPLSTGAGIDAVRRDVSAGGGDRRGLPQHPRLGGAARRGARRAARRLRRQAGDRPRPSGRHQRDLPLARTAVPEREPV